MSKHKICLSIDEKIVAGLSAAAAKRGTPISEIAQTYFSRMLSHDIELTAAERFYFQRDNVERSLDNVLTILGISSNGGLSDKWGVSLALCLAKSRQKNRQSRYAVIELSLFEILNNIKEMDINLFEEWVIEMGKYGRIKNRYFNLYPKLSKKGITEK